MEKHKVTIVLVVGASGTLGDLERYMEFVRADLELRSVEIARDIMGGRIEIVAPEEVIHELAKPTRPPSRPRL